MEAFNIRNFEMSKREASHVGIMGWIDFVRNLRCSTIPKHIDVLTLMDFSIEGIEACFPTFDLEEKRMLEIIKFCREANAEFADSKRYIQRQNNTDASVIEDVTRSSEWKKMRVLDINRYEVLIDIVNLQIELLEHEIEAMWLDTRKEFRDLSFMNLRVAREIAGVKTAAYCRYLDFIEDLGDEWHEEYYASAGANDPA